MIREERTIASDLRAIRTASGSLSPKLVGHAALFNTEANLGPFTEVIEPGAFRKSIGTDDVRALFNHDPNYVLGRNTAGTLRLSEDSKGLAIEIDPPETGWARDLQVSIKRGDISQMSFGFFAKGQRTERRSGVLYRFVTEAQLLDVSPATYPAYKQTDIALRGARSVDQIYAELVRQSVHPSIAECRRRLDVEAQLDVYRRRLELVAA